MREQIKKYIRGNKERGHEVIAELEKLGGKNALKLKGNEYDKIYYIARIKYSDFNTIDIVSEKSFIGQLIVTHPDWEEIELPKHKYPTTHEECLKVLSIEGGRLMFNNSGITQYERELYVKMNNLSKLLICRDAYWKIAGEEMGLDKSWEPDWNADEIKHSLVNSGNTMIPSVDCKVCRTLAFPSKEMRDAFYQYFKELIKQCKELL